MTWSEPEFSDPERWKQREFEVDNDFEVGDDFDAFHAEEFESLDAMLARLVEVRGTSAAAELLVDLTPPTWDSRDPAFSLLLPKVQALGERGLLSLDERYFVMYELVAEASLDHAARASADVRSASDAMDDAEAACVAKYGDDWIWNRSDEWEAANHLWEELVEADVASWLLELGEVEPGSLFASNRLEYESRLKAAAIAVCGPESASSWSATRHQPEFRFRYEDPRG